MNDKLCNQLSDIFITMPRQFGRTKFLRLVLYYEMCYTYGKELVDRILDEQGCSIDEVEQYLKKADDGYFYYDLRELSSSQLLSEVANQQPSISTQITILKSQLKHCKNYLERQNIERRLNRLYKERR